ncbi:MAG: capsule biosynthesis protein [Rhodobacteraceae bacterium]|nr:capsule biosynthesis protein [Paracoccaceae bacterium]
MTSEPNPATAALPIKPKASPPKKGTPAYYRMARRKAVRMGLSPSSGEEAAKMLEDRGFDVTRDRVTMLDTAASAQNPIPAAKAPGGLGQPAAISNAQRQADIRNIQKAMARRRKARFLLIALRLFIFVVIPTYLAGNYFYNVATPMYQVDSQMVIQKPEGGGSVGGIGGLLGGGGLSNLEDSVIVQGYLGSREAMIQLDEENGFIAHFQQEFIDDIQRLPADSSLEAAYKKYKKYVRISYDPTEGVIRLSVIAITPAKAAEFAGALIRFAEDRVDNIAAPVREDQLRGAKNNYDAAEQAVLDAADRVLELQKTRGVFNADAEISGQMAILNNLEGQLVQKRLDLEEINSNLQPNQAQRRAIEQDINGLLRLINARRTAMTMSGNENASLARVSGELRIAQSNLEMRQMLLQQSLSSLEAARIEANRQTRYLSLAVAPIPPDEPSEPKKLENTMLALALFLGLYIFLSLTVSILREQIGA